MQYRKEIDGLRAIAVLPVIFFHADLFGASGGYVGVDIFFVISGYLITNIIMEEIERQRFSLVSFYERRARRILPALSVVLVFSTVAAFILMPAYLLKSYSQSLVSVATFSSNVFFYLTSGYFDTASDEKPLLHTWSLAVEEQYYIFFPVLLSALWFVGKRNITILVSVLSLASLLLAQHLSDKHAVNANFYLIFSRAWELFAGSLVAIAGMRHITVARSVKDVLGCAGLSLIAYSVFFFDNYTPFPSIYALAPVIGTVLIISFCDEKTIVGKMLSNRLFVGVGLISYSLYLWHQPLFAFLRMKTIGEPSEVLFLTAIAATFVFALMSYKFVEKPFRNRSFFTRKKIFVFSVVSMISFMSMGMFGHFLNGFEGRFGSGSVLETAANSPKRGECHASGEDYIKPEKACRYFGDKITWASFGDSHTVEPAYALATLLKEGDEGLLHLSFSGCPPSLLFEAKQPGCSKWIREALSYLEEEPSIENVLLGFRFSTYLFGDHLDSYPYLPSSEPVEMFAESYRENFKGDARALYWASFNEIVRRLLASGKSIYLLYPVPELPMHIAKAAMPFSIFGEGVTLDLSKSTAADYYFKRNDFILSKLDSLAFSDKLHAIKPFDVFCSEGFCPSVIDDKALYFDDNHLSVEGARLVLIKSVIAEKIAIDNAPGV